MSISKSGARSGSSEEDEGPRSPPNPPSPRAKIDRCCVHSGVPSVLVTLVSSTTTAALPLSQTSTIRLTAFALPDGGNGPGTITFSEACKILARSISTPGQLTFGGSTSLNDAATQPNVGNTCGVPSTT